MTPVPASQWLYRHAARWRRRQGFHAVLTVTACALLAGAVVAFLVPETYLAWVAVGVGVFASGLSLWAWRRTRITPHDLARHLDRRYPELEDSCTLLLAPNDTLNPLQRLQRARVARQLARQPMDPLFPYRRLVRSVGLLALALSAAVTAALWSPVRALEDEPANPLVEAQAAFDEAIRAEVPRLEQLRITVRPPAYTGRPVRRVTQADLAVEEGARVQWSASVTQPVEGVRWVFSDGTVVPAQRLQDSLYQVAQTVSESGFYTIELVLDDSTTEASDYHKLDVLRDERPVIRVHEPAPRTRIDAGMPKRVAVHATVEDDYGVGTTRMIATVAKGSGEGVKFREDTLVFGDVRIGPRRGPTSPGRQEVRMTLNLDTLGMEPGDELYFHLSTFDNRRPVPQRSRSETFFVNLPDTAERMVVTSEGFGVDLIPEYFRSQRQIIIDTEALIEDRVQGRIDEASFKTRSNDLGIDQKLLRLRYGQYLGEEFETGVEAGFEEGVEAELGEEAEEGEKHDHEHEAEGVPGADRPVFGEVDIEAFTHSHDSEENATLFSTSVRSLLKASLDEMWDAELHLRLHRPEQALPYEYRALELLKETQQRARIYVQRIGFEPTPLKPEEQRFTGDLSAIESRRLVDSVEAEVAFPEVRDALIVLHRLRQRPALAPDERAVLEHAGRTLAEAAVEQPGRFLDALQALRTLLNPAETRPDEACPDCRLHVERAFWQILPPAEARPQARAETRSTLGAEYLDRLGRP